MTIKSQAIYLAQEHRKSDPKMSLALLFPSRKEIRLLEVSNSTPTTGEILPFTFAPAPDQGVTYPLTIILLSPEEWDNVQKRRLDLPKGWNFKKGEKLINENGH